MATRPIIVLGHRPDGSLEAIYAGGDGGEAEAAFEAAGAPDFVRVEEVRFPPVSRRRDFEVPELGTEEEPKAPKPKKPTKAELKKAEKEAKEAEAAAQESEQTTATEDEAEF